MLNWARFNFFFLREKSRIFSRSDCDESWNLIWIRRKTVSKDGGMRNLEMEVRQSKRVVVGAGQVHTGCWGIPQHLTVWLSNSLPSGCWGHASVQGRLQLNTTKNLAWNSKVGQSVVRHIPAGWWAEGAAEPLGNVFLLKKKPSGRRWHSPIKWVGWWWKGVLWI